MSKRGRKSATGARARNARRRAHKTGLPLDVKLQDVVAWVRLTVMKDGRGHRDIHVPSEIAPNIAGELRSMADEIDKRVVAQKAGSE